jgi:hypothetical protein
MAEFVYQDLLPLGEDVTSYRLLTREGVSTLEAGGRRFLEVDPAALTELSRAAMRDIAHLFRTGHLQQLADILRDPEASPNDRFVALELLKNACVAAGGVLPSCQDTGTAIVMGKKGERVLTGGGDEAAIARGVFDAYRTSRAVTDACRRHGASIWGRPGDPPRAWRRISSARSRCSSTRSSAWRPSGGSRWRTFSPSSSSMTRGTTSSPAWA